MKGRRKRSSPAAVGDGGEPAKGAESVAPGSAPLFDLADLLRAAETAVRFGLSPCALLSEAVRAEARLPSTEESLASLVENNDPSRMVDVFESPTFRKRLRELRVWARTTGIGPDAYVITPGDLKPGTTKSQHVDLDRLISARKELHAIGKALAVVGPNPPLRRKRRFEEMVLLQNEDGSALLDDEGLPMIVSQTKALKRAEASKRGARWQPMDAIERNLKSSTGLMREAMRLTKGLRKRPEIRTALESEGALVAPPFRDTIADILTKQKRLFPHMRAEAVALCWAYRVDVDPSVAAALRERRAERQKKSRRRGGHSSKRNAP